MISIDQVTCFQIPIHQDSGKSPVFLQWNNVSIEGSMFQAGYSCLGVQSGFCLGSLERDSPSAVPRRLAYSHPLHGASPSRQATLSSLVPQSKCNY